MTLGLGIITFLVVLAVLILVHELGHFTFAKLLGVRVEEFGLGFPPRLRHVYHKGTIYSLNAIPIGGFVKMLGENGDQSAPDSFGAKAPWKRLLILVAGPSMNMLLAITIYFFVFMGGSPRGLTEVTKVTPGSPAVAAGIRVGDRIVEAAGRPVTYFDQLHDITRLYLDKHLALKIRRDRQIIRTNVIPRSDPPKNQGPIGVELGKTEVVSYGPVNSLGLAFRQLGLMIVSIPTLLQTVSQHGGSGVTGPIGIAHLTTRVVQNEPSQGFSSLFEFVALLSANLGVLNLLPIPALDGGRIVFVLISWVRRRNLDPEVEGLVHMVGMAVLLLLITFISYHDLVQWISGSGF